MVNNNFSLLNRYQNANRSRRLLSSLLDTLIFLIITLVLFVGVSKLIGDNLPFVKENLVSMSELNYDATNETKKSHLIEFNNNDEQIETKTLLNNIIIKETKSSLIYHSINDFNNYDKFITAEEIDYVTNINDNLYYYYNIYKIDNSASYEEKEINIGFKNYYLNILKASDYFILDLVNEDKESYFNKDITISLGQYFFNNDLSYQKVYDDIYNVYLVSYQNALTDYDSYNLTYKSIVNNFNNLYYKYLDSIIVELFISYVLASFITYLLPGLVYKNYASFSDKAFKITSLTLDNKFAKKYQFLIKNLVEILLNLFILWIIIFLVYGNMSIVTYSFMDIFNIASLSLFSILLAIFSLLISFINKEKSFLSDYLARLIKKDERQLIKEDEDGSSL